jgi:DNA-binding protein Fis
MVDNFYKSCLPKMSDGRNFTELRTDTRVNEYIKYLNGIQNHDIYRLFLQQNAHKMLDHEFMDYKQQGQCKQVSCIHHYPTRMSPYQFTEERLTFNASFDPAFKQHCRQFNDYRLSL